MQVKRWVIMPRNETGACQGQDACLKHWMNWNCSEKCGFIIKLRNFISCVSLIGDNSHLTFKPRPDSKKKKLQLLVTTSYKTDCIPQEPVVWGWLLWAGCLGKSLENTGPGDREKRLAILQMETLWPREGMGLVHHHPATEPQDSIQPEWLAVGARSWGGNSISTCSQGAVSLASNNTGCQKQTTEVWQALVTSPDLSLFPYMKKGQYPPCRAPGRITVRWCT